MSQKVVRIDETRTDETRAVKTTLIDAGFLDVDAYRVNSAVICIRVVDPQFAGLTREQRLLSIEPHLEQLPKSTQVKILTITAITPDEPGIP